MSSSVRQVVKKYIMVGLIKFYFHSAALSFWNVSLLVKEQIRVDFHLKKTHTHTIFGSIFQTISIQMTISRARISFIDNLHHSYKYLIHQRHYHCVFTINHISNTFSEAKKFRILVGIRIAHLFCFI